MSKTITRIVDVFLAAGTSINKEEIFLPTGTCTRVAVEVISGTPDKNINLSLVDTSGSDVIDPHSYKFWKQRQGGDFFDSMKPVNFECGTKFYATLNAPDVLANDVTLQFMFFVSQRDKE